MTNELDEIKALPLSRTQQAVEMVRRFGMSKADAARAVGVTPQAVSKEARRQGLRGITDAGRHAMGNAFRRLTPERKRFIVRRAAAEYRARHGYPSPLAILEQHEKEGATYTEIANRYGLTRSQVAGFINRARKDATTYA